jgi:endonuclease/exonuclease/phosphatase family metal-dependent hydrolase
VRLRLASYNVHRCIGRDGVLDPARTLAVIAELDADVVGLQEVDAAQSQDTVPDLLALARELGYQALHGVTLMRPDADYGNALLSRRTLADVERIEISVPGYEPRGLLAGTLSHDTHSLRIGVTHFGLRAGERRLQARRVAGWLPTPLEATVLLGDLNEWRPFEPALRGLNARFGAAPRPASFPARWPMFALDRILASPDIGLRSLTTHRSTKSREASDHLPLLADIELR